MIEESGRALADALVRELRPRAARFRERVGRAAALAAVAPDDAASARFVRIKQETFGAAGLELRACWLRPAANSSEVLARLHSLNADSTVDGIFLQYPLPPAVDGQRAADIIDPEKDIDAAGSSSLGRLVAGTQLYLPATTGAVHRLLEHHLGSVAGRSVVVVGGTGTGELSLALVGTARGAITCIIAPSDPALEDAAAGADAIVITDQLPPGDSLRYVRNGAILIDAG